MKKVFKSRSFLLSIVLLTAISTFTIVAGTKNREVCLNTKECLRKMDSNPGGEMLWEVLSRQFISAFFFH